MQEVNKYNIDDIRKEDAEKKQVEALKSTAFGNLFIDPATNKPNKALAGLVFVGFVVGVIICEWYAIANGWPKIRRILVFDVTWGFPIGAFVGMALGFVSYRISKVFKK
ncbi:MAG: hypothetical protein LBB56_00500 [Chitinispirillales bacterium]|nr:hypothetical protein [Chitinispirillales bacterium]